MLAMPADVLGELAHRVGTLAQRAVGADDLVLVGRAGTDALDHGAGPHARSGQALERVVVAAPAVPLAHHVHRAGPPGPTPRTR